MKKWKWMIPVLGCVAAVGLAGGINTQAENTDDSEIADRIYIGDISVGGMTKEEAKSAVNQYIESLSEEEVKLTTGETSLDVTVSDLGLSWANEDIVDEAERLGKTGSLISRYKVSKDLEHEDKVYTISLQADTEKVAALLGDHAEELNQEPVNYKLSMDENGEFVIGDGAQGVTVNVEKSVDVINDFFVDGWFQNPTITLVADIVDPEGTKEELQKVKDVLGTFHTDFGGSSSGRVQNVKNGCSKINGSVIYPGETFSVHDAVNPMDAENGYALAGSYENGTTVQTYGGGICQVSTTLYNAVIRAELEIVERSPHSMAVSYVDPSADAAIAGDVKDLKFKNTTDAPIYIEGYTSGSEIYFTIYGHETREEGREVSFESETLSVTDPTTKYVASSASIGTMTKKQSSHTGRSARLWKIVTINGEEVSRDIFNTSNYSMSPTIYEVGTSSPSSAATAAMKSAIASQSESTIRAAMAQWANATADTDDPDDDSDENEDDDTDAPEEPSTETPAETPSTDTPSSDSQPDEPTETAGDSE